MQVGSSASDSRAASVFDLKAQTKPQRLRARVQFATVCGAMYLAGWNDGTTGPLLPRIQKVYDLNFAVVSLIFVFACVGFLSGAFANLYLDERFGFGKVIVIGSVCQVIAYAIEAAALPFPAFVLGYVINGFGMALQDAQSNGFVASLKDNPEVKMGILHAVSGGALSSPLVATQFAQLPHWSFHYLCSLGVAFINTVLLIAVFGLKTQDECLAQIGQPPGEKGTSEKSQFSQILRLRAVHLLAFFILTLVGVEVTVGGWMVTYIIDVRGGGPSSGYISSGFWGGLMVGRVTLLWVNKKVGERRVLFIYAILAIGLQLVVWLVPSLIGGGVAVSLIGVILGPMYPIAMNHTVRILPEWLITGSIGWIAGFGQAGSALLPFLTGAIASKTGIKSLQPFLVSMMAFLTVLWALVPTTARRTE
ncbi:major facilitator superfamily domain-containing protein [Suillus fuscotomentosus]|uniref:Major facilitator superfamily domain-containing protein n=1 Tax=Suillus fuscotomentosus TaxID=1912939 RepID=A0AAD4EBH0_9AGAM|nr:major facilitator superfamily domain-containing protein [Suillus fuscotomentosus]KAG1903204.1 major facilitator superfamily domain-containing protein [Suillus fuscotomentosus]